MSITFKLVDESALSGTTAHVWGQAGSTENIKSGKFTITAGKWT